MTQNWYPTADHQRRTDDEDTAFRPSPVAIVMLNFGFSVALGVLAFWAGAGVGGAVLAGWLSGVVLTVATVILASLLIDKLALRARHGSVAATRPGAEPMDRITVGLESAHDAMVRAWVEDRRKDALIAAWDADREADAAEAAHMRRKRGT